METLEDLERQIKELERDKRIEEIKQLRAGAKARWITPTALAALLPLCAGFGLWIVGELKQYNEGFQALAERNALRQEKETLQKQKDSLNIEVSTLLQLKAHYAEQAERLQRDTEAKQETINQTYLSGVFTSTEALYALDHIQGMGPPPNESALNKLNQEFQKLPGETAQVANEVLQRCKMSLEVVKISREVISEFNNAMKVIPAADWTRELQALPTGAIVSGKKIMILQKDDKQRYYDVDAGRYLTEEESKQVSR